LKQKKEKSQTSSEEDQDKSTSPQIYDIDEDNIEEEEEEEEKEEVETKPSQWRDLEGRNFEMSGKIVISCLSISRFMCEHLPSFPLSAISRILGDLIQIKRVVFPVSHL